MTWARRIRAAMICGAVAGLIWPGNGLSAGELLPATTARVGHLPDVRLDASGTLHGVVVDAQGHGLPESVVILSRVADGQTWKVRTNDEGQFVAVVPGGTFRLQTSEGISACRVWTSESAPPRTADRILVVNDRMVQRGQRPIRELFTSDPIFIATLVAAAIAIPIAVHKSRDDSPSGS